MKQLLTYCCVTALLLAGCSPATIDSKEAMLGYMSNPENGLKRQRTIGGFEVQFQYLPPAYLAMREAKNMDRCNSVQFDSLTALYDSSYTFVMTLGPDEDAGETFDIMFVGVDSEAEYNERVQQLNFRIGSYLHLKTPEGEYAPVLSRLENTYGLARHRKLYLVFNTNNPESDLFTASELDLTWNDELFGTGISHYVFNRSEITALPPIDRTKLLNG